MPIQPFALNLSPSPTGDRVAAAIAYAGGRPGIGIVVRSAETGAEQEIAALDTLHPVALAWDDRGRTLAMAADSFHAVWSGSTRVASATMPPSQWLEFDAEGMLWGLGGERLWSAAAGIGLAAVTRDEGVLAACARPWRATVRRRRSGLEVHCDVGDRSFDIDWPLSVGGRPRIQASPDGRALFVAADNPSGAGRVRLELARINLDTRETKRFFEREVGIGVGWSQPAWSAWTDRSVLLAAELDDRTTLFDVRVDTGAVECIGPPGFEIAGMSAAPEAGRVALVGSSIDAPDCRESALVVCTETRHGLWRMSSPRGGVNAMPSWDRDARKLFFVHSHGYPHWRVAVEDVEAFDATAYSRPEPGGDATAMHDLELPGPRSRNAALVYIAGPHRRIVDGGQVTFFHHAILSLMKEFADEGCIAVCLNPPGAAGWGRAGREPDGAWSSTAQETLTAKVRQLEHRGVRRIAIVAGSLGTVPALNLLRTERLAGAVMISPVYGGRAQPLEGWQHLFHETDRAARTNDIAAALRTPVLVVHGLRDEMVPSAESSGFITHVPKDVACEYLTLIDEGHVFSNPESWQRTLSVSRRFLRDRLGYLNP